MAQKHRGPEKLKAWMEIQGITQRGLAAQLGVSPAMIHYLTSGAKAPGLALALEIEAQTLDAIALEDWDLDESARLVVERWQRRAERHASA